MSALDDLKALCRIRFLEEKIADLWKSGDVVGSVHLCIGQEAGPIGVCSELLPQDPVFATYRGHGWALARGVPPVAILAEVTARATGVNGGRAGSAFFTAPEFGFFGENSIVGAGLPIAVGAALAAQFDGSNRVVVAVCGDGALNQGASHEALNMAAAFRLPVVFVCENNRYSELTLIEEMVGQPELWKRARAYGMLGGRYDGNDPDVVRDAAREAVDRARRGAGPTLIELMTERLVGHYLGDPQHYRPSDEVEQALAKEPIARLQGQLIAQGVPQSELDAVVFAARDEINEAAASALSEPVADPSDALEHLYA